MSKKHIRIITGAYFLFLFLIDFTRNFYGIFHDFPNFWSDLTIYIGFVLIALGIFAKNKALAVAGCSFEYIWPIVIACVTIGNLANWEAIEAGYISLSISIAILILMTVFLISWTWLLLYFARSTVKYRILAVIAPACISIIVASTGTYDPIWGFRGIGLSIGSWLVLYGTKLQSVKRDSKANSILEQYKQQRREGTKNV